MRVLIVDDTRADAELIEHPLQQNGLDTFKCYSITSARSAVRDFDPDLVLLDMNMPDSSWDTLGDTVAALKRDGVLVVVTVMVDKTVTAMCTKAGVDAIIDKALIKKDSQAFFLQIKTVLMDADESNPRIAMLQDELSDIQTKISTRTGADFGEQQNSYLIKRVDKVFRLVQGIEKWKVTVDKRHSKEDKYVKIAMAFLGAIALELSVQFLDKVFNTVSHLVTHHT